MQNDMARMIKEDILTIIKDARLSHKQTTFALAEYAMNLCDYPLGTPTEEFQELEAKRILCDHNDGHAPYSPRYILPDYDVFLDHGCAYLRLPPPNSFQELLSGLLILYMNVPSVTHYPVYGGRLDRMLERFIDQVSQEDARRQVRQFLIQIDRMISDSFFHINIGPEETKSGRILIEELSKLGVFFVVLNCICLGFMQFHATFYFNYIIYSDLLIFRCQNVAAKISLSETFRFLFVISFHFLISSNFPYIHQQFLHLSIYLHNYYIWDYYNSLA